MNRFLLENVLLRPYQLVMAVGTLAVLLINGAHKGPLRFRQKNGDRSRRDLSPFAPDALK